MFRGWGRYRQETFRRDHRQELILTSTTTRLLGALALVAVGAILIAVFGFGGSAKNDHRTSSHTPAISASSVKQQRGASRRRARSTSSVRHQRTSSSTPATSTSSVTQQPSLRAIRKQFLAATNIYDGALGVWDATPEATSSTLKTAQADLVRLMKAEVRYNQALQAIAFPARMRTDSEVLVKANRQDIVLLGQRTRASTLARYNAIQATEMPVVARGDAASAKLREDLGLPPA